MAEQPTNAPENQRYVVYKKNGEFETLTTHVHDTDEEVSTAVNLAVNGNERIAASWYAARLDAETPEQAIQEAKSGWIDR